MQPMTTTILLALFLLCCLYAVFLELLKERYIPNWTWLTVVAGNSFFLAALWGIEALSEPLTFRIALLTMSAAGIPILIWQAWQYVERQRELKQGEGHAAADQGRPDRARPGGRVRR